MPIRAGLRAKESGQDQLGHSWPHSGAGGHCPLVAHSSSGPCLTPFPGKTEQNVGLPRTKDGLLNLWEHSQKVW